MPPSSRVESSTNVPIDRAARTELDLKTLLTLLDACFMVLERSALQLRGVTSQARTGLSWLETISFDIWNRGRRLPRQLERLTRTGWMLTRIITSYRLWPARRALLPATAQDAALTRRHKRNARLFVETSLAQGGAFLKIGQLLSSRSDLLPAVWIEELSRLQDQALPESFDSIRKTLETAWGKPLSEVCAEFNELPLAAASIGQVHRAKLLDGRVVAIKVQRTGITHLIETDLTLLELFLGNMDSLLPGIDTPTLFNEIRRSLREELDYRREAASQQRISQTLEHTHGVICPAVITALSNDKVLVTHFIEGKKLTQALDEYQTRQETEKTSQLMTALLDAWLTQVLQAGFFHADPHPGNLLVTADNQLVLLDFGACQALPESTRLGYLRILQAAIVNDDQTLASTLDALGFKTHSGDPATLLAFCHALLTQLCDRLGETESAIWPAEDELVAQARELLERLRADPVEKLPGEFIMLARVFMTLGGLFIHYRPTMDLPALMLRHLTWQARAAA